MSVDLSALNAAERQVLLLLAQGHTAKSVASQTGVTVHSVNERLREARRKTGAGSSRELARLLAAEVEPQENRATKIGVGERPVPSPRLRHLATLDWRWIAMAFIALAAAALFLMPQTAPTPPRVLSFQPVDGGAIHAGKVTLELKFDRPMRSDSYSFVRIDEGEYPDCSTTPRQSDDHRSFYLDCVMQPARHYAIGVNVGRFRNFVGEDGIPASPWKLIFGVP